MANLPSKRPKILFLFSDTGGGHRSPTEAIIEALKLEFGDRISTQMVDIFLDIAPRPFSYLPKWYTYVARFPEVWGAGYRISNGTRRATLIVDSAYPYVRRALHKLIDQNPADMIVSLHPLANNSFLHALGKKHPPFITVVTDLASTHSLWYHKETDLCLVPTETARERGLLKGLKPDQIKVVGLPVADRFCQPVGDKKILRQQLGWPQDKPVVLLVGGGEGMGPLEKTARAIAEAFVPSNGASEPSDRASSEGAGEPSDRASSEGAGEPSDFAPRLHLEGGHSLQTSQAAGRASHASALREQARRALIAGGRAAREWADLPGELAPRLHLERGHPWRAAQHARVATTSGSSEQTEPAQRLPKLDMPITLVIIAGRNKSLRERLEAYDWPTDTLIYGFVNAMPDFMRAADILVTKAGASTVSEALNAGLPMIIYSRLPGQEDGNVDFVITEGVGIWAPDTTAIVDALRAWIEHPEQRGRAAEACCRAARPEAAREIAHILASRLGIHN